MAVLVSQNFDANTVGQIAPGWTAISGTWVVGTVNPVSSPNSFGASSNGNGDFAIYGGQGDIGYQKVTTRQKLVNLNAANSVGTAVRFDSAGANGYLVNPDTAVNGGGLLRFNVFKKTGGSFSDISGSQQSSLTVAVGDTLITELIASGTTLELRFWLSTGSRPSSPTYSRNDLAYSTGRPALYRASTQSTALAIDDFVLEDDQGGATEPGAPTIGTATAGDGYVDVAFSAPSSNGGSAILDYTATLSTNESATGTTSPIRVSASNGTARTATVKARNAQGSGPASAASNSVTPAAAPQPVSVSVSDANWIWSPYNWDTVSATKRTNCCGAYMRLGFTGTSIAVGLDVSSISAMSTAAAQYPTLVYSLDNKKWTVVQLTSATTSLSLTGLASGNHTLELYFDGSYTVSGAADRWNTPGMAITITGATLDNGAATVALATKTKRVIWFGDSITEGSWTNGEGTLPTAASAIKTVPFFLRGFFDAEVGQIGYGGQGFGASGVGNVPAFNSAYGLYSAGRSRLVSGKFSPEPDTVVVWQGANGTATSTQVTTAISNMRAAAPNARIFVLTPATYNNAATIVAAVASYKSANPSDVKVHAIDPGADASTGLTGFGYQTKQAQDAQHPRSETNAFLAPMYAGLMQAAIDSAAPPATTARTVSLTLVDSTNAPRASLSGLKWAWFDTARPDVLAAPIDKGANGSTNASGVLTLTVNTTLASGATGYLVVSDTDGTTTQNSKALSRPVQVT